MIRKTIKWSIILALSMLSLSAWAQSVRSLRINEVLVINESSIRDRYGNNGAWVEIYNTSAAILNLGGCYLTDDTSMPMKYRVPRGDRETLIPPRQHKILWLDGAEERGTFHTSIHLDPERENTLALYESDGKTLIDKVIIPSGQRADVSYARTEDGKSDFASCESPTPQANNRTILDQGNTEYFKMHDEIGLVATLISMLVVFTALIVAYIIFKSIGKAAVNMVKKKSVSAGATQEEATASIDIPGDVYAAIGMALYEHTNSFHDEESTVITIDRVRRRYSPWSSKIHTLTQRPQRKVYPRPLSNNK
ncbi:OadG family transporter subunit [Porphyromonas sp.]|uniref:OadG family transporter subunit n=1 Tax=Porphyromonas sp. TaxID=1924944 RepID=UPI0026DC8C75|nr:OadG family transporter subunit [Porphyromonas sp.]MDO4771459.1 OadG family transporter subunit [Porphyromonas sp.]